MITNSGPKCDLCGKYILPLGDEKVNVFSMPQFKGELHCHNACKENLEAAKTWEDLLDGPIKEEFSKIADKLKKD